MKEKQESAFDFYLDQPWLGLQVQMANFEHGKGLKRTCKVGSFQPNKFGLYDMHGNMWEWCDPEQKMGKGASQRVLRGGCWRGDFRVCRATSRFVGAGRSVDLGLRLARVPVGKQSK